MRLASSSPPWLQLDQIATKVHDRSILKIFLDSSSIFFYLLLSALQCVRHEAIFNSGSKENSNGRGR
jgi:hypothetical protein